MRDRNLPVARLVPFSAERADDQELALVAAGKLCLPKVRLNVKHFATGIAVLAALLGFELCRLGSRYCLC